SFPTRRSSDLPQGAASGGLRESADRGLRRAGVAGSGVVAHAPARWGDLRAARAGAWRQPGDHHPLAQERTGHPLRADPEPVARATGDVRGGLRPARPAAPQPTRSERPASPGVEGRGGLLGETGSRSLDGTTDRARPTAPCTWPSVEAPAALRRSPVHRIPQGRPCTRRTPLNRRAEAAPEASGRSGTR